MLLTKLFLIALPVFFAIDMVWLGLVAKGFYRQQIGSLMRSPVNWVAAVAFYLLFILGLVVFVVAPAMDQDSCEHALLYGALFGFIAYATYDLTNLATLRDWPLLVTVVDLAWGAVLAGSVSVITYAIGSGLGLCRRAEREGSRPPWLGGGPPPPPACFSAEPAAATCASTRVWRATRGFPPLSGGSSSPTASSAWSASSPPWRPAPWRSRRTALRSVARSWPWPATASAGSSA